MKLNFQRISYLAFLLLLSASCQTSWEWECQISTDCPDELFCQMGRCTDLSGSNPDGQNTFAVEGRDDGDSPSDAGFDGDIQAAGEPHPCPDAPPASQENLILNEFLAYVPTGPEGDANGDGVRHAHDDEFVELVNISAEVIDLTDVVIANDTTARFTFPPTCLEPLHAVVVFGGIEPGAELPSGEGWDSFVADSRFAYANGGGRIVVNDHTGVGIADFTYGAHPAESLNLDVDLWGSDYVPHGNLTQNAIFSPGTCVNGQPFTTGCIDDEDAETEDGEV